MRDRGLVCRLLGILLLGSCLAPTLAGALEIGALGSLGGSYKNLLFHTKDRQENTISTDLNRLRLEVQGGRGPLSWRLVNDFELLAGGLIESPDFSIIQAARNRTLLDLDEILDESQDHEFRYRLYRAVVRWEHRYGQVLLGRQRIAWGSGRLWNPTDIFNPIEPTVIEPNEKTGVDALLLSFTRGPFGALQLVGAPGDKERQVDAKAAIRWRDTIGETDYALLLAYIDESGQSGDEEIDLGLDFTTNLFDGGLRLEALYVQPASGHAYGQVVSGYDYRLSNTLFPAGLYMLVEYFYNGNAITAAPFAIPGSTHLVSRSQHQLGLSANYDLMPLLNLSGIFISDLEEGSRFFAPSLTWSVTANIDLSAAVQLFGGPSGSQFGGTDELYLLQAKIFF